MRSPTGYACRKCNRISYFSQTEDALGRIWRRQVKIERRLGVDRERPPGMHQITSEWLLKQLATCEATRYGMAAVFLRGRAAAISLQLLPDARPHRDRVG
jgi:hypothetical protein